MLFITTVDRILKSFNKTLAKLEALADVQERAAEKYNETASDMHRRSVDANKEAFRARA